MPVRLSLSGLTDAQRSGRKSNLVHNYAMGTQYACSILHIYPNANRGSPSNKLLDSAHNAYQDKGSISDPRRTLDAIDVPTLFKTHAKQSYAVQIFDTLT